MARKYNEVSNMILPTMELGYQNYDVVNVEAQNSNYIEAYLDYNSFHAEYLRLLNDSSVDALVKINNKKAFTLLGGSSFSLPFDSIKSVKLKSKTPGEIAKIEVSIWGRNDLEI